MPSSSSASRTATSSADTAASAKPRSRASWPWRLNCQSQDHPVPEPCGVCDSCREIRAGNSVDVIEIDAATNRGIDEIRELREAARYRPARDRYKIWILDEAHQITDAAFNALLKTLEEPPGHVVFMMATTQPEDIPQTIRSRCQHFSFHAVRFDDIVQQLRDIAKQEGIAGRRRRAGHAGRGGRRLHARRAQHHGPGHCLLRHHAQRRRGARPGGHCLLRRAGRRDGRGSRATPAKMYCASSTSCWWKDKARSTLPGKWCASCATRWSPRSPAATRRCCRFRSDERARVARVAERFSEEDLTRFLQIMLRTHSDLSYKQEQRFHLELGLLKLVHAQRLLPLEELLSGESRPRLPAPARRTAELHLPDRAPSAAPAAHRERRAPVRQSPSRLHRALRRRLPSASPLRSRRIATAKPSPEAMPRKPSPATKSAGKCRASRAPQLSRRPVESGDATAVALEVEAPQPEVGARNHSGTAAERRLDCAGRFRAADAGAQSGAGRVGRARRRRCR